MNEDLFRPMRRDQQAMTELECRAILCPFQMETQSTSLTSVGRHSSKSPDADAISCGLGITKATSGVLALLGDHGYPYAVPMNYVLYGDRLYFHSATVGHKIEAVKTCEKASFCVIEQDDVLGEKFTTAYRSVIAFGKISISDDADERLLALKLLAKKYSSQVSETGVLNAIAAGLDHVAILRFEIEHLSGKQGKSLVGIARKK